MAKGGWVALAILAAGCGGPGERADAGRRPDGSAPADDGGGSADAGDSGSGADAGAGADAGRDAGRAPDAGPSVSPDVAGPYEVDRSTMTIDGGSVVAFVPRLGGARAPLVVVKHGFQLSTSNYAVLCERIASHGFVVLGVDTPGSAFGGGPTNVEERDATIEAIDFATGAAPFSSMVDGERVAVLGHSRGGKVAVMVAAADARVDAALLLDPVNGCGPGTSYSTSCPDVTGPAYAGSLTMPVGVMGETNNASGGFMPCAPADQNYQTIYDALTASSWAVEWTFTGADHMDFTDDGGGTVGGFCPDGPGDDATIRAAVRALSVAFVRYHLRGEADMLAWLAGASLPADIVRDGP